ncbi:MAG TPA: radical SAM protein [Planctomycetota bacterium]|nr:radical SAM protein [Planctomycetota bacterium]
METTAQPASPQSGPSRTELAAMHDFAAKLRQPSLLGRLQGYVRWQAKVRAAQAAGQAIADLMRELDDVPISINLDLTTACNYACDHCVDFEILNTGARYEHEKLLSSLELLAARGLKSVIVIGGGEPTTYPKFEEAMIRMKDLGLKLGLVTNGTGMAKVRDIAHRLDARDWVRLSLDSGTDETFQRMHKPRKAITLDQICEGIPPVKAVNRATKIGFSYIIVWRGCSANDAAITENVHEMYTAAERARRYGFDYISFKPFLVRADENNAEIVDITQQSNRVADVMGAIRQQLDLSKRLETDSFKVVESTNLRVLANNSFRNYTRQPQQCHMQLFRQVLSPLGLFNCPVYRHVEKARIGDKHAWAGEAAAAASQEGTARLIQEFDASHECREVTCLYNNANWFVEDLIRHPEKLDELLPAEEREDWFL